MASTPRRRSVLILVLAAVVAAGAVALVLIRWSGGMGAGPWSAVPRGRKVAERSGCFACHGPDGLQGIPNPGAPLGEVPAWSGGTFMMFNESPAEIREWILDGMPARLRADPGAMRKRESQILSMPAYRGRLGEAELEDLVAYVQSVAAAESPPAGTPAAAGRDLAVRYGCLGCHGPEGRGLLSNPGSLKGYIPGWDSPDYEDLVRGREEFHEWVATGEVRRLRDNPAAAFFLDRQVVRMPAFGGHLGREQVDQLLAYVTWVRARPRPIP